MTEPDTQRARAAALNLHGLLAHWNEVAAEAWVKRVPRGGLHGDEFEQHPEEGEGLNKHDRGPR